MKQEHLQAIVEAHGKWLRGEDAGERAVLRGAVLRGAVLRGADLRDADLSGADLSDADLSGADLSGAVLRGAVLRGAVLRGAVLSGADLSGADLRDADLRDADLRYADLRYADLSGAVGAFDPCSYIAANFKRIGGGIEVFKTFGMYSAPPESWVIKEGSIIEEVCNPTATQECGCGVNVATRAWVDANNVNNLPVWRCLIKWEWMPGVVVPWGTDGKIRAGKVKLLEVVS
jgi:hypothetical protein